MNNKTVVRNVSLLLVLLTLFASCGIKMKGARKGDNASVETFLVENGVIQYFVKPLSFTSSHNKILADFTFRGGHDSTYAARVNFTISGTETNKVDSIKLVNSQTGDIIVTGYKFTKNKTNKGTRYFSNVNNNALFRSFASGQDFLTVIYGNGGKEVFSPTAKSAKKIRRVPSVMITE